MGRWWKSVWCLGTVILIGLLVLAACARAAPTATLSAAPTQKPNGLTLIDFYSPM